MSLKLFIAGTDTNIGKTFVSVELINAFNALNQSTLGLKPIASGCQLINGKLYNEDALALQNASSIKLAYEKINPIAFEPAIAPHIAAQKIDYPLNLKTLGRAIHYGLTYPADICLVEGAGGWLTLLNHQETLADFVRAHHLQVILVVGIRLGCLNHALLTLKAMERERTSLVGWIANCVEPRMEYIEENITTLKSALSVPNLGIIRYGKPSPSSFSTIAEKLLTLATLSK